MNTMDALSVRVWQGYKNIKYAKNRDEFVTCLENIFIPVTWQWMQPLGCKAYIPALLPDSGAIAPDEIALVFYNSQDQYQHTAHNTSTGRAYGKLHELSFDFSHDENHTSSWSKFPILLPKPVQQLELLQPYSFSQSHADWHKGKVQVCAGLRRESVNQQSWVESFTQWITSIQEEQPSINAYVVLSEDYFCFWYLVDEQTKHLQLYEETYCTYLANTIAEDVEVDDAFSFNDSVTKINDGQALNLKTR